MSRFAKKTEQQEPSGPYIPAPPAKCGCYQCDGEAFVTMALCRVGDSTPILGTLSGGKKTPSFSRKVKGKGWLETQNFQFVRWIARCVKCYMRENRLDRALEDAIAT